MLLPIPSYLSLGIDFRAPLLLHDCLRKRMHTQCADPDAFRCSGSTLSPWTTRPTSRAKPAQHAASANWTIQQLYIWCRGPAAQLQREARRPL